MKNQASESAGIVAAARAVVSVAPQRDRIIEDHYAKYFFNGRYTVLGELMKLVSIAPRSYYLYSILNKVANVLVRRPNGPVAIAVRHHYIDERIKEYVTAGAEQVILLGAGFDMRAYRLGLNNVQFIEVDHFLTQRQKLKRLKKIKNLPKAKVKYCVVDFTRDWLPQLEKANVIKNEKSVFVLEGISMYLGEDELAYTLLAIKKLCPLGANLLFDTMTEEGVLENSDLKKKKWNLDWIIPPDKEPIIWGTSYENLEELLEKYGFKLLDNIGLIDYGRVINKNQGCFIPDLDGWPLSLNDAFFK